MLCVLRAGDELVFVFVMFFCIDIVDGVVWYVRGVVGLFFEFDIDVLGNYRRFVRKEGGIVEECCICCGFVYMGNV